MTDAQLPPPELGKVLRRTRAELGLTLDQLSARSGISKSMLSQIERGLVNPTFSIVWNMTQALGLDLSTIVGDAEADKRRVIEHVREYSTPVKKSADGKCSLHLLSPKRTVLPVEWYDLRLKQGGELASEAHAPGTYEHVTCLEGRLCLDIAQTEINVEVGETVRYYADQPHTLRNSHRSDSRALLLIALPSQFNAI